MFFLLKFFGKVPIQEMPGRGLTWGNNMRSAFVTLRIVLTAGCILLAHPSFAAGAKKAAGGKGTRERVMSREATLKSKDQKNIDFDAVDIGGQRKAPMGTLINQNKSEKEYDFVKIRLRWHPEMVQSASSLDNGKSK